MQKSKLGIHSIATYEVAKVAQFFIVFRGGRGLPRRSFELLDFSEKAECNGTVYFHFFK